ncbi:hypothetical protein [Deinococcus aquaticus]|uniref:hypothetical protein n=1 Tax=Deinococcus aquaticus TaxID=328692 RepID=UPI003F481195
MTTDQNLSSTDTSTSPIGDQPAQYAVFDLQDPSAPRFIGTGNEDDAKGLLVEAYRSDILDYREEDDFSEVEREFDWLGSQGDNEAAHDIYLYKLERRYRIVLLDSDAIRRSELTSEIITGDPALQLRLSQRPEAFE